MIELSILFAGLVIILLAFASTELRSGVMETLYMDLKTGQVLSPEEWGFTLAECEQFLTPVAWNPQTEEFEITLK